MNLFNAEIEKDNCIAWIKDWFNNRSGSAKGIVIGISGGKDSTVAAKLCADAIGIDKVFGVLMPNKEQKDLYDSVDVCRKIGINYCIADIGNIYNATNDLCTKSVDRISIDAQINIAPRIRMMTLYAIGQTMGYRVCGTGNACEKYVGYTTKWGDAACDFNPLANFKVSEVVAIGDSLGLPYYLVHKIPNDGLSESSDEEKLGVTYAEIESYLNNPLTVTGDTANKISRLNELAQHKIEAIPTYKNKS